MKEETKLAVCGLCGDKCFVDLHMKDGRVTETDKAAVRPNLRGNLCLRGAALKQYLYHPDRIHTPMRRVGEKGSGKFEPIGWDEAFAMIAERLQDTKKTDGARATVFYSGHPKWYRYMLAELARDYGSPNFCTESSTCNTAPRIAHSLCYGMPVQSADVKNCKTLICWGTNPAYTKFNQIKGILNVAERGDQLIVVDPRCTPTSERATLHMRPRHGTDGALALAIANVILQEGLEDRAFLEKYAQGFAEYAAYAAQFTPERGEKITGVPAGQIVEAGRMIGTATPLSIFISSCGIAHAPNSVQAYRAIFLLLALTGSFDCIGGNHGPAGETANLNGFHHRARPRVDVENEFTQGRFPVWNRLVDNEGQAMGLDLAILSGKPYPIRNVIAFGMNHRMFPESERMREALLAAEFYVDVDLFMTESAKCADLILPCAASPERENVYALQNNHLLYLPAAVEPGEKKNDVEIIMGICSALGLQGSLTGMRHYDEYMEWMLEQTGVTLADLRAHPEGLKAAKLQPGAIRRFERGLKTPSGKIEFVSAVMEPYKDREGYMVLPEYADCHGRNPAPEKYPLVLCAGVRRPQFFHSRTYRMPWLSDLEHHTLLDIHPEDAARLGIKDGDEVELTTPVGSHSYRACLNTGVLPGSVNVLHDDGNEQNINDLVSADYYDPISGFPGFRCYFCSVRRKER